MCVCVCGVSMCACTHACVCMYMCMHVCMHMCAHVLVCFLVNLFIYKCAGVWVFCLFVWGGGGGKMAAGVFLLNFPTVPVFY